MCLHLDLAPVHERACTKALLIAGDTSVPKTDRCSHNSQISSHIPRIAIQAALHWKRQERDISVYLHGYDGNRGELERAAYHRHRQQ